MKKFDPLKNGSDGYILTACEIFDPPVSAANCNVVYSVLLHCRGQLSWMVVTL